MIDYQTLGILAAVFASVAVILYVWDRRSKHEEVDVMDAAKLAIGAGGVAGGVAYAVGTDAIEEAVSEGAAMAQEMFVGKPEF
jgi:hypothetical protein